MVVLTGCDVHAVWPYLFVVLPYLEHVTLK